MSQLKSLLKDISIYGISEFLNRSVQVFFLPIIFAFLSTSEFGVLDLFLTTKNILIVIFGWGMITAVQRFGGIKTKEEFTLEEVVTSSFIVVIVIDFLLGIIFYLLYSTLIETDLLSFTLVIFISLFYALRSVVLGVLRLQHRAKEFLVVTLLNILVYLIGTFLLIKYTDLSYVSFLVAGVIGIFSSCIVGLYMIRGSLRIKVRKDLLRSIFKFGASLLSTTLIVIFVASSNRYSLILFGDSIEQVGILGMSHRISLFVGALLVAPFTLAWLPFVNENHNKENFSELVSTIFKSLIAVGLFLTVILMVIGYPVLLFFGKSSYVNSMQIAPLFCLAFIFQACYYVFSSSFYISEQNKLYVKSSLFVFIVNILALAAIIPITNYVTVSIVTMLTNLSQMLYAYKFSSSKFKLKKKLILKILATIIIHMVIYSSIIYIYEKEMLIEWLVTISLCSIATSISLLYILFSDSFDLNHLKKGS